MLRRLLGAAIPVVRKPSDNDGSLSPSEFPHHGMIDPFAFWDDTNPYRAPMPYPMSRRRGYELKGPVGKVIFIAFALALGFAMIFL